jgi:hypothetical protein
MDTQTKQELEALRIALQNFINATEDDSQIPDRVYYQLKSFTDDFEKQILQTLEYTNE